MNKNLTINVLQEHFSNLTPAGPEVIRAERRHGDKPIGVFYFDFSESVIRPEFDLLKYMQERIASDFYKHEGSLQWNYYLYFVLDKVAFRNFRNTPKAADIEADRTFARKFIREQATLDAELKQPLASILHATKPHQDVASRWVEALKDAGLARIADPNAEYESTVRLYLSGTPVSRGNSSHVVNAAVPDGRFIRSLNLERFRMQPVQKSFDFRTVNLVRGVNGTGKTSLLEAVELCICGGIRRQQGKRPDTARLQIQYEGSAQPESCPESSLAGYRDRDLAWYGGYYRKGNYLCENFGRFNFFDSDAAFKLSAETTGEEIVKAVNALLLGELATTLEERMVQFQTRFATEERQLQRLIKVRQQELDKASQQIEQLKTITDTRDALSRDLQVRAKSCGWKKLPAKFKLDNLAVLQEAVENAATQLAQHVERLSWLARVSIASLTREERQLGEALQEIIQQRGLAKKNSIAWERTKNRMAEIDAELKILVRLREYHSESDALSLLGSNAVVKGQKAKIAQLKEALSLLRNLDLRKFEKSTATLDEIAIQHDSDMAKCRRRVANLKSRAAELQTQLGTIKTLVQEIKGLGRRFCEINPHSNDCPLCGAHYDLLSAQIASLEFGAPMESSLREVTAEIAREQATFSELKKAAGDLAQIRQAAQVLFSASQLATRSIKSVADSLVSVGEKLAVEKTKLDELISQQKRLKLAGFDEDELQMLIDAAQDIHSLPRSKLMRGDGVQTLVTERIDALDALRHEEREKERAQKEIEAELRRIIRRFLQDTSVDDGYVELNRRKALVEEVLNEVRNTQGIVSISDSVELSSVKAHLDMFAKAVRRIQQALKTIEEKDALEQRLADNIVEARTELDKLEPKHARAKTLLSVMTKLLGSEYKEAYRRQIITDHKAKLSTIFSRIHAPHEFKDVHLNTDVLLERDTGELSPVSEISTGQRAALALSIFLSLNSSVSTKAPWLLFDDPIVHVDDLNILSFLDMLRDLVLLGNRQVFFATANTRIADLFAKKFDFLGEEFREFQLQR